jgi:hypothetical protein
VVGEPAFLDLGLTDAGLVVRSRDDVTVLTDDLNLYVRLASAQPPVLNFNHVRAGAWGI